MKRILALIIAAAAACCGVAADVYQITGNVTEGIDLVGGGYATDRLAGPSGADASVGGTITHADGLTTENPFQLIGHGKKVSFTTDTGLELVPLKLLRAEGVSGKTEWRWNYGVEFRGGVLFDFQQLTVPFNTGVVVCGDGSSSVDMRLENDSIVSTYSALTIGTEKGDANLVLKNSRYVAQDGGSYDLYIGREASPGRTGIRASMTLENSSVTIKNLYLMYNVDGSNAENCFVTNGIGSTITALKVSHGGGDFSRFVFNGGRYVSNASSTELLFHVNGHSWSGGWPNPRIYVEGANGNPIDIEIAYDRNLSGGSDNRQVDFSGDGGFIKRGAGVLNWTSVGGGRSSCNYTGDTVVKGGGIKQSVVGFLPGRGALVLEAVGTTFDLNGIGNALFTGVSGLGTVVNTSATAATLSLGYNNANGDWNAAVVSTIPVEKIGTGTLTIGANAAAYAGDLTVSAGTAKLSAGVSMTGLGTVTIAKGATLDIRGATIGCKKFVNEGTLLSDGTGSLVLGGDEDQDFENPAFAGSVEKTGSAAVTLHGGLEEVTALKVSQGTLRYFPTAFSGKYFKLTFVGGSDWAAYAISEMSLFDANGNRINQGEYSYSGVEGAVDTLAGISACETALMGAGGSYHHSHNNGEGPNTLFDGNPNTTCVLRYSWGNSAVGFRIADDAASAVGYSLTSSGNSSYVSNGLNKWTLHGSYDGVNWILLDDRSSEAQTIPTTTATEYNGGKHYLFASGVEGDDVIPGTLGSVEVAADATLDPSVETVGIATLTIDCAAGAGSITRFTPVENGTLVLKNIDKSALGSTYVLPITVGTVATPSNLKTWKVSVGGQIVDGYRVRFRDGKLVVCGAGLFIVVK